jgi:hypothetical protein
MSAYAVASTGIIYKRGEKNRLLVKATNFPANVSKTEILIALGTAITIVCGCNILLVYSDSSVSEGAAASVFRV